MGTFLRTLLISTTLCVPTSLTAASRPNVVLITVDDMNCDSVGAFGCPLPNITPHIDRLAAEGIRFEYAHVTIAICQPTRAVWMTGRYPHRNGALGFDPIRRDVPTLLEALKGGGYFTGILAKVPHVIPTRGNNWDVVIQARELKTGRDPRLYYQHTVQFLRQAALKKQPFFLMANSQDPHRPFAGSAQELARSKKKTRKKSKQSGFPTASRIFSPEEVPVPGFLPDLPPIRKELAQYYTSVHRADQIVGSVLKALRESGEEKNTLVLFLSDHGMPLPFAKTNCWWHSTRTPWIVRWPGIVQPERHDRQHMIAGIDLAPTVLDAVGLRPLPGVDGHSFVPVLRGKTQNGFHHVITQINRTAGKRDYPMRSILDKRFSYVFNAWPDGQTIFKNESQNGLTMKAMRRAAKSNPTIAARVKLFLYRTPEELYDYQRDPDARHNLARDPRFQKKLNEMRSRMLAYMKSTGDRQATSLKRHLEN